MQKRRALCSFRRYLPFARRTFIIFTRFYHWRRGTWERREGKGVKEGCARDRGLGLHGRNIKNEFNYIPKLFELNMK